MYVVFPQYYNISNEAVSSFSYYANNTESKTAEFLEMTIDFKELVECIDGKSSSFPCKCYKWMAYNKKVIAKHVYICICKSIKHNAGIIGGSHHFEKEKKLQ